METLIEWNVVRGFQFENLVLNNLETVIKLLNINSSSIQYAAPYFQKKTKNRKLVRSTYLSSQNIVFIFVK